MSLRKLGSKLVKASAAAALGLALTLAHAQTGSNARISGQVTDGSGGAIVGAAVTVRNVDTGINRITQTLSNGSYTVPNLTPGRYTLTVEESSFKKYQQQNITLLIGQIAEIDPALQIGTQQEQITVTAGAPVIQTEDSSVGLVIDAATIVDTPLNGRLGIQGLLGLAPGVQAAGSQDQIPVFGITPAINTGGRNAYGAVGFRLDGGVNLFVSLQRPLGEVPPLDGIAEFRVLTTNAPAEYNQAGQVVVISRGGVNQVHGLLVEFNRIAATAAKFYFAGAVPKPKFIRNEFGGNFSGPIVIPRLYNGHNRSFFFFNVEAFRLRQANSSNTQNPTMLERQGIFTEFPTLILKDPATGLPFPNGNQIPMNRINPVALQLQNILYPLPTSPGTGVNTTEVLPFAQSVNRLTFRLDHKASSRDQFRASYVAGLYGPNPTTGATSRAGGQSGVGERNQNTVLGWTHILSPTAVLDVTAAYLHLPVYRTPQNSNVDFSSIIPGLGPEVIAGAPQISISNIQGVGETGSKVLDQAIQLFGDVTKTAGRHTVKFGVSYLHDDTANMIASAPQRGSFSFNGQYSGNAYADFLLGDFTTAQKPTPNTQILRNISHEGGLFIQDDYRATRHLTLNLGLRYDLQHFDDSKYGNNALYVPSLGKIVVFGASYPVTTAPQPAIPGFLSLPIVFASQVNLPGNVFDYLGQSEKNFAPRIGFAYETHKDTVVRGGFGIYYNLLPSYYIQVYAQENLPFFGVQNFTQPTGTPTLNLSAPFASIGAFTANPNVNAQHSTETPYTEQYNLAVEHEFPGSISVRVGYVGQRNIKQNNSNGGGGNVTPDINQPTPAAGAVQPRRPIQPFASIYLGNDPIFHSDSNAVQVGVHKRFTHGFQINAEYEHIRVLGTENFVNPQTPADSFGNIGGITPNSLNVSYSYTLPFGTGHRFLGSSSGFVDRLVGGFEVSGITQYQGGQPFSVNSSASVQGSYSSRADRVLGQPLYPGQKTKAQFFNTAAFQAPANFTFGNSAYNMLFGPRYQDWDVSLAKNTRINERLRLQLRADSFNAFNHPNFANPGNTTTNLTTYGKITNTTGEPRTVAFGGKLIF